MFAIPQLSLLILVMARTSAFFVANPIFSRVRVPGLAKVGLAFFTAVIVWPMTLTQTVPTELWIYVEAIIREIAVGLFLGFAASIPFYALHVAGDASSTGMGFAMSRMTGVNGEQVTHISQLYSVTFALIFLTLRGHLWLFELLGRSFTIVPLDAASFVHEGFLVYVIRAVTRLMIVGLQIGMPIMGITFLVDIAMGLLAKSVPQINVFFFGFPIKILIGLGTIVLLLTTQFDSISVGLIAEMQEHAYEALKGMALP